MTPKEIVETAIKAADERKAQDIVVLHVTRITTLADYFIICSGNSNIHLRSITDAVDKSLAEKNQHPKHIEGYSSASWILMDYGSVIVHVLNREMREFYGLERLWGDAERLSAEDFIAGDEKATTVKEHKEI